jgi:hypothetical protein
MPIKVTWTDGEPNDREEWEDLLRAEYGTALGPIEFEFERIGDGWKLARVIESSPPLRKGVRVDQRSRFVRALRIGGKPVLGEWEEDQPELEAVGVGALNDRAEQARRKGDANE